MIALVADGTLNCGMVRREERAISRSVDRCVLEQFWSAKFRIQPIPIGAHLFGSVLNDVREVGVLR